MNKVNIETIIVHCPKEEDAKTLIQFLYQNTDYHWLKSEKTETHWQEYQKDTCYHLANNSIFYSPKSYYKKEEPDTKIVSFDYFYQKYIELSPIYMVKVKRKKNQTIATLFDLNGKYVKHAEARCHYKDKYDFEVGEKLAIERLFSNPIATPKSELYSKTYVINMLAELIDALEGWIEVDRNLSDLFCGDLTESPLFSMKESFEMLVFDILLEATGHKEEYAYNEDINDFFFSAVWNLGGCGEHICRQGGERFAICSAEELYEFFMNYEKMKEYFELED